jgi:hypothetical protein
MFLLKIWVRSLKKASSSFELIFTLRGPRVLSHSIPPLNSIASIPLSSKMVPTLTNSFSDIHSDLFHFYGLITTN